MSRTEIINLADKYLKIAPDIRKNIMFIDTELKNANYSNMDIKKLQHRKDKLQNTLSKVIRAINILD